MTSLPITRHGAAEHVMQRSPWLANVIDTLRLRSHLFISLLLTALILTGSASIVYYAIEIWRIEEVEEDASRLLLNAERWINLQERIDLAIRGDRMVRNRDRLAGVKQNREAAAAYERNIRELLDEHPRGELSDAFSDLMRHVAAHEKAIDEVAAHLDAGRQSSADELLAQVDYAAYLNRTESLYARLTALSDERRNTANRLVTYSAFRLSIIFTMMSALVIGVIWLGFAMSTRARRRMDELSKKLASRATHDTLTGLPNRDLFYDRLSQSISAARRKRQRIAVFYMDLDGFKEVNDTYSHQVGDATLREAARRLRVSIRKMDTVARLGGDEFAIIVNDLRRPDDAGRLAEKIIAAIGVPMQLYDSRTYQIGISIGIALYPDSGGEIDRLVKAADQAMYQSKLRGKNCYSIARGADGEPAAEWIDFSDDFLVGVKVVDEQHQALSNMLNAMNRAIARQESLGSLAGQFDELTAFVTMHFQTEEQLMKEHDFPEFEAHCEEHRRLLDEVEYLNALYGRRRPGRAAMAQGLAARSHRKFRPADERFSRQSRREMSAAREYIRGPLVYYGPVPVRITSEAVRA